jgi:hypothetical protein
MAQQRRLDRRDLIGSMAAMTAGIALPQGVLAQPTTDPSRGSMAAAEELSQLEATEHLPALYTFYARMHPDARAIVPRHVVIGWYQDVWQPRGPQPARATGYRFVDWTWPVNGVTYRDVSEVSFVQGFDNAATVEDVVRLAWADGEWRWFFGRDRAWVDEQIETYNARAYIDQEGSVPWDLDRVVTAAPEVIGSLPLQISGAQAEMVTDARQLPTYAASMPAAVQYRDAEYPVGYAMAITLADARTVPDTIASVVWERIQEPPFRLIAWNLAPVNDVPFARFEHFGSEAIGNVQTLVWGAADGDTLWTISFRDEAGLQALADSLVRIADA